MSVPTTNWEQCLACAHDTDVGMRRSNNQDAHRVQLAPDLETYFTRGHLLLVADGMGAHAAGELASRLAIEHVPHLYHKHRELSPPEALAKAVQETNAEIHRRGEANSEFHNMGTTLSALLLVPQGALVAQVGDTRIYRLRGNKLEQLTFDHSLVWEMKHDPELAEQLDLAGGVIPTNVITRSLGPKDQVKVDVEGPHPVEVGDTFLLCSDGLSGQVPDEDLGPLLACLPPAEAVRTLIDLANLRGGPDNITAIVAKATGPQIATGAYPTEPLVLGGEQQERTVHPALWVGMGVALLASLAMLIMNLSVPALVAAVAGVFALTAIILQLYGGLGRNEVALVGGRRLGKGPYTETVAEVTDDTLERFAKLLAQLEEATRGNDWDIDHARYDQIKHQAGELRKGARRGEALRQYAKAITFMMGELRGQRGKRKTSDSSVDL